jgi:WD40-like Beta Propeller Repeat
MKGCAIRACVAPAVLALLLSSAARARAQGAKFTVNDDCTAFAFSPDGSRIVYAARRYGNVKIKVGRKNRKVPIEHDDIWEVDLNGRTHRLVDGSKLVQSTVPVSFAIQAIQIAPDNQHMTIQMETRTMTPQREASGKVESGELTDLMDGAGKEIEIEGTKNSGIKGAVNAAWLADGKTVVYMKQPQDSLLYTLAYVRPLGGRGGAMLPGHSYAAVAWNPVHNVAAAIERDADLGGPIRLVWIDLIHQTERTLAELQGFNGHLTVSPSATKIAYFRDGNTIEIRSVASPDQATQIKVPYGRYEWSADGTHLLLKRGRDDQTNQLIWISLPDGQYRDVFHGLLYHNFHVSPDGRWVGLTEPGMQILKLFPVP